MPKPRHPNAYRSREIINDRWARRAADDARYRQQFKDLHRFVEEVIGPWATQARISQLIAEDFDEMALDRGIKAEAQKISFQKYASAAGTPQVGHARFVQLAPSRVKPQGHHGGGGNNVIHRGLTEQEFWHGGPAVRIYVTVFAEVQVAANGLTPYKDIHQNPRTGQITIYTGNQANPILWVNIGQPLRALKWLEKYKVEKRPGARPVIRSFCLPVADFLRISRAAILEHDAGLARNAQKSFNVDRHYASDQFGLRGTELGILKARAVPGSLISYVPEPGFSSPRVGGQVLSTQALRHRLGIPQETISSVWVDAEAGEFTKKDKFKGIADRLMNIYGTWIANDEFIVPEWARIPRARRLQLMRDYLHDLELYIPAEYWERIAAGAAPAALARSLA